MEDNKKYEEALERAKDCLKDGGISKNTIAYLEEIFPELKESEDERIRKEILDCFRTMKRQGCFPSKHKKQYDSWIAWLEKQGEQKPIDPDILIQQRVDALADIVTEQKPIDKVEPKFRIEAGKWYICISQYGNCIESRCYQALCDDRIIDDFGTEYDMHSNAYKYFRLWTIQDAKKGDVLVHNSVLFIFMGIENGIVKAICTKLSDTILSFGETEYNNDYCPATKKQRDTLIKAMADAGYTFDFDKKELKKIEQETAAVIPKFRIGDEIKTTNEEPLTITKIDEKGYWSGDLFICDFNNSDNWELVEQKPVWSEEDEDYINDLIKYFSQNEKLENTKEDIVIWLKSLKDRVQSKQEWSKKDENNISFLTSIIEECFKDKEKITLCGDTVCANFTKEDVIDRLKSLRPRWKPSDEQIKALEAMLTISPQSPAITSALLGLYEQLKKLTE